MVIPIPPTARVGRPSDPAKHAAILAAAQRLFAERGFTATSMAAVAAHAGVSKLTAYRHFGSKDELFTAAVAAKCESMLGDLALPPEEAANPRSALMAFGRAFLALILHPQAVGTQRIIVAERERAPALGQLFYQAAIAPTHARLGALIRNCGLPVADSEHAAADLIALWRGRPMLDSDLGLRAWDDAMIAEHVAHGVDLCLAAWQAGAANDGRA